MNRRALLKSSLPILAAGLTHNLNAAPPKFSQTKLKKNVVLVTSDFGLYNGAYQEGKHECAYFRRYFQDFKGDVTYFNNLEQPGLTGGGHIIEHATFTTMRFDRRHLFPERPFISLDQHLAEYSVQETRHKSIYHKVVGDGENTSFNSMAQPNASYNGLAKLHNELFGASDLGKIKQNIAKQKFILKELYNNTKRRFRGTQEEKDMVASIDYKIRDLDEKVKWLTVKRPKISPKFNIKNIEKSPLTHCHENYNTIFEAIEKQQTKIALIQFGKSMTKGVQGISHGFHTLTHHGNYSERVEELQTLDGYMLKGLRGFLKKLKDAKLLEDTIVIFNCGMADANKHSGKKVPAFLFGGGFKHQKYVECQDRSGKRPKQLIETTHLYSSILKQAGFSDHSFSGNKEIVKEIF